MFDPHAQAIAAAEAAEAEARQALEAAAQQVDAIRDRLRQTEEAIAELRLKPTHELTDAQVNRVSLLLADAADLRQMLAEAEAEHRTRAADAQRAAETLETARRALNTAQTLAERDRVLQAAAAAEKAMLRAIARAVELHQQAGLPLRVLSDVWRPSYDLDRLTRLGVLPK
jgi:chromosome segregation ATPase